MKRPHHKNDPAEYDARKLAALRERIVPVVSGCHEWRGFVNPVTGYAQTTYRGRTSHVHRLLFILLNGPVPRKIDVCHSCDNRKCCNPEHLWLGTRKENLVDASSKGRIHCQKKTHCPRGHEYAVHGQRVGKDQWRTCKICNRAKGRLKAGWPEHLAFSPEPVPHGQRPVGARWER